MKAGLRSLCLLAVTVATLTVTACSANFSSTSTYSSAIPVIDGDNAMSQALSGWGQLTFGNGCLYLADEMRSGPLGLAFRDGLVNWDAEQQRLSYQDDQRQDITIQPGDLITTVGTGNVGSHKSFSWKADHDCPTTWNYIEVDAVRLGTPETDLAEYYAND